MLSDFLNQTQCVIEKGNIVDYIQALLFLIIFFLAIISIFSIIVLVISYHFYLISYYFILPKNERGEQKYFNIGKWKFPIDNSWILISEYISKYGSFKNLILQSIKNPSKLGFKVFINLSEYILTLTILLSFLFLIFSSWLYKFHKYCNFLFF